MAGLLKKVKTYLSYSPLLMALTSTDSLAEKPDKWIRLSNTAPSKRFHALSEAWVPDPMGFPVCQGHYNEPLFIDPTLGDTVRILADQGQLSQNKVSTFTGDVFIEDRSNRFFADTLHVYRNEKTQEFETSTATGDVFVEQPGARLLGTSGNFDFIKKKTTLFNSDFHLYQSHIRGHAEQIDHTVGKPFYLKNTTHTTCAPGDAFWQIKARDVTLNTDTGMGQATHAVLSIKNIPVLYTPYITFPIGEKRKSGFLMPSYQLSKTEGSTFVLPYYFNLAPNYDATVSSRTISSRGIQILGEFRYLTEKTEGDFQADTIAHDHAFVSFQETARKNTVNKQDPRFKALNTARDTRGSLGMHNKTTFNKNWASVAEFHYLSDDNYLKDFNSSLMNANTQQLNRELTVNFNNEHWQSATTVQSYLTLQPFNANLSAEPYRLMPRIDASGLYPLFSDRLNSGLNVQYTRFDHPVDVFTHEMPTVGNRLWLAPGFSYIYQKPYFYFTPKLQLNSVYYQLDRDNSAITHQIPENPSLFIPISTIDSGLFFERNGALFNTAYLQTLEPRAFYTYIPYKDQSHLPIFDTGFSPLTATSLTRTNRFTGNDRYGDTHHTGLSLTSRFFDEETGEERANWQFGQLFYFSERRLSLCDSQSNPECLAHENPDFKKKRSNLFASGLYHINNHWQTTASSQWDSQEKTIRNYTLGFNYLAEKNRLVNIIYTESKDNNYSHYSQINTGISWPISPRWNILGHFYYDISEKLNIDTFGGLEYNNCCWAFRFGNKQYLKLNNAIKPEFESLYFFEFILKGLSSFGESHAAFAKAAITGYEDTLRTIDN